MAGQAPNMEQFEAYFQRADLDRDGRISGSEAVTFLLASNLPKPVLAQIWTFADQKRVNFLGRSEFYNALKLVTVAQSNRALTPDLVKAALYGPASSKIPAPKINLAQLGPQSNANTPQFGGPSSSTNSDGVSRQQVLLPQQSPVTRPPQPISPAFESQGTPGTGPSQVSNRSLLPPTAQVNFSQIPSPIPQNNATKTAGPLQTASSKTNDTGLPSSQAVNEDTRSLSSKGNGFADSVFGDVFNATPSQPQINSSTPTYPVSSPGNMNLSREQLAIKSSVTPQPPNIQAQQFQSVGKPNQHGSAQKPPVIPGAPKQSQPPWPKMTQYNVEKYSKVFVQVDTDRDGKITGEQARNLFMSWGLPREVLKQIWDLSDQDNDSMLSLREFCFAVYLMERHREGRSLPSTLPNSFIVDETLFVSGPPGNTSWRPGPGLQQGQTPKNALQGMSGGPGKPPRPVPVPQPDEPIPQKAKVPVLEKQLVDQLSTEEQDSLNKKFEDAKDAEKKVADLEKDIFEAKKKVTFYHAKMQELIVYKSKCDNRLNEISERVVADKREAESLAKKYEEKYKQTGDVASKLTIEEATFRDIQEKKMELYRSIVKLEQENADGVQDRVNQIQSELEELVKALNERCKTYGLRGKPTSLVELPFGWQPGIEGTAADWDEDWDKFEDEGFTYVKELTLEVENVVAHPKPKSGFREQVNLSDNSATAKSPSKGNDKSELQTSGEGVPENDSNNSEQTARTPPDSPAGSNTAFSPSKEFRDMRNGSPHAFDTQSDYGADSVFSGDKRFDEPTWGSFDTHYDADAAWDSNPVLPKEAEFDSQSSLFTPDEWGLNPIKTGSKDSKQGPFFDSVPSTPLNQGPFFDSVPSTPLKQGSFFDSVPSTPLYNMPNSPHTDNLFARNTPNAFADSAPSTPMYNFSSTPRGSDEQHSFDSFSRFDSFNMHDTGPFGSRDSFSRFDSMRSTRDSTDFDQGYFAQPESLTRFDSFRSSTADSDYNFGAFPPSQPSLTRFDSMSSTRDLDYGQGFSSFDDTADPFGSGDPFRTSHEAQTPRKDSDSWKAF